MLETSEIQVYTTAELPKRLQRMPIKIGNGGLVVKNGTYHHQAVK